MAGEQKNAVNYEQIHGRPQPRDFHGRFDRDGIGDGLAPARPDWEFIHKLEGTRTLAYVPLVKGTTKPIGNSGVTIATGFDLGQWSERDFNQLEIHPPERKDRLKELFRPFFGATKETAIARLHEVTLRRGHTVISDDDAHAIDMALRKHFHHGIRAAYERDRIDTSLSFDDLPGEAQTVLVSVAFNRGLNLRGARPEFWKLVVGQDWPAAARHLRDWGKEYEARGLLGLKNRRDKEATLLERIAARTQN